MVCDTPITATIGPAADLRSDRSNKEYARTAYKPDFVPFRGMTIPLPLLLPTGSSCQPEPAGAKASPRLAPHAVPIWRCSQWGLPCQNCYQLRGGLLLHRFTLTRRGLPDNLWWAVYFLWRFPSGCPARALPGTVASWSPDFPRGGCPPRGHPAIRANVAYTLTSPRAIPCCPRCCAPSGDGAPDLKCMWPSSHPARNHT